MLSGDSGGVVKVWKARTMQIIQEFDTPKRIVQLIAQDEKVVWVLSGECLQGRHLVTNTAQLK